MSRRERLRKRIARENRIAANRRDRRRWAGWCWLAVMGVVEFD